MFLGVHMGSMSANAAEILHLRNFYTQFSNKICVFNSL
jgi:hypothetical protein